jgi:hypothetical protein
LGGETTTKNAGDKMKCARTACESTNAVCRHTHDNRMYCPSCAHKINEHNPQDPPLVELPRMGSRVYQSDEGNDFFPGYQNMISHAKVDEITKRHEEHLKFRGATHEDCWLQDLRETDDFDKRQGFNSKYQLVWKNYLGWKVYMNHTGCFASIPKYEPLETS